MFALLASGFGFHIIHTDDRMRATTVAVAGSEITGDRLVELLNRFGMDDKAGVPAMLATSIREASGTGWAKATPDPARNARVE